MLPIFTLVIFLSAALLFLVQPMVAKLILPLLGGSPSVWNTCMVFFQALLLAGYFYSHVLSKIKKVPAQALTHLAVLGIAAVTLPLALPKGLSPPTDSGSQTLWLLKILLVTAGLPYFAVSTTGPLLQRWFSRTTHPHAVDPYFLYAASNAGSILGLLAYPFGIEPSIALSKQGWLWTIGYGVFVVGVATSAWLTTRYLRRDDLLAPAAKSAKPASPTPVADRPITNRQRFMWTLLAAIPSSLMLGVTNHVSTDVAAVPLLWIIPLTLYLLTFILAFSPRVKVTAYSLGKILPVAAIALGVIFLMKARNPLWILVTMHFGMFLLAAWMCHARLAASRPPASKLTEFYLWIAVGGVLGGSFNALLAPVIFESFLEYPIAIVLALMVRPRPLDDEPSPASSPTGTLGSIFATLTAPRQKAAQPAASSTQPTKAAAEPVEDRRFLTLARKWALSPVIGPLLVGVLLFGMPDLLYTLPSLGNLVMKGANSLGFNEGRGLLLIVILPSLVMCFLLSNRVLAFALGFAIILSAQMIRAASEHGTRLYSERTFFGIYDVFDKDGLVHTLRHGTTMHGAQAVQGDARFVPRTYYFPNGPIGEIFDIFQVDPKLDHCAFVGLGSGTLAAYGKAGRQMTFFEIDPAVVRIAQNPDYFTFLTDSDSKPLRIVVGDARLKMAQEPDGEFGLIVLDAFSSDAIPVHLMTKEATEMYLSKLRPDGILAFHISNRYLDLSHVLGAIAGELNLVGYGRYDVSTPEERNMGKSDSKWVVLARSWEALKGVNRNNTWLPVKRLPTDPLWTDDFSNVLSIIDG